MTQRTPLRALDAGALLAEEAVVGPALGEQAGDQLLGGDVHLGDDVDRRWTWSRPRRGRRGGRRAAGRPRGAAASSASSRSSALSGPAALTIPLLVWSVTVLLTRTGCRRPRRRAAGRGPGSSPPGRGRGSGRARPGRSASTSLAPLGRRRAPATSSRIGGGEPRVGADGRRAAHRQAQLRGLGRGLGVEVVQDLHVVRDEPDGHHHDGRAPRRRAAPPGGRRCPAPATGCAGRRCATGRRAARGGRRRSARARRRRSAARRPGAAPRTHRRSPWSSTGPGGVRGGGRDGVRGEGEVRAVPDVLGEVGEGGQDAVDHGLQEAGVVEVVPQLVDPRQLQALGLQGGERVGEVLAVLAAARVRGVRAGGEDERCGGGRRRPSRAGCRSGTAPSCGCPSRPAGPGRARRSPCAGRPAARGSGR